MHCRWGWLGCEQPTWTAKGLERLPAPYPRHPSACLVSRPASALGWHRRAIRFVLATGTACFRAEGAGAFAWTRTRLPCCPGGRCQPAGREGACEVEQQGAGNGGLRAVRERHGEGRPTREADTQALQSTWCGVRGGSSSRGAAGGGSTAVPAQTARPAQPQARQLQDVSEVAGLVLQMKDFDFDFAWVTCQSAQSCAAYCNIE